MGFLPREHEARSRQVLDALNERLPHYMRPSDLVFLDEFPLNSNGKIDRGALADRLAARGSR